MGLWTVRIPADRSNGAAFPERIASLHLNTVRLLETTPCVDCLAIGSIEKLSDDEITVDLTLRHPYPSLDKYTGFDVRGIFVSDADYEFPVSGRRIAWSDEIPRMLNADGYTALFNPNEYPATSPPALGYIYGRWATGGDLSATLNPFVAYARDAERRIFEAGSQETQTVRLKLPDGPVEFGYAVDACWHPVSEPVVDPIEDFPIWANSLEAYSISFQVQNELASETWSYMPVQVVIYDHQGEATISSVSLESPDLFSGNVDLVAAGTSPDGGIVFGGFINNEDAAEPGDYPLLIRVTDRQNDLNFGEVDAWNVTSVRVTSGWAQWWCGGFTGPKLTIGPQGDIFSAGSWYGWGDNPADLEPGPGKQEFSTYSASAHDSFLNKFDSDGNFQWVKVWGGSGSEPAFDTASNGNGDVFVVGAFTDAVDFDPGPDVEERTSNGDYDVYLCCFDCDGNLKLVCTLGGPGFDTVSAVTCSEDGEVLIVGSFKVTVDFDPGPALEERTAWGGDCFLCLFNSNGDFQWVRTWGGPRWDENLNIALTSDAIYIVGEYLDTCDFDPGPGVVERTSAGMADCFVAAFDGTGVFKYVITWGGPEYDSAQSVAIDSSGNIVVAGQFTGTTDFDPGPGLESRTAADYGSVFTSKLSPSGQLLWVLTTPSNDIWSGWSVDCCIDDDDNIYSIGVFLSDIYHRYPRAFLTKMSPGGEQVWTHTWGKAPFDASILGIGVTFNGNGTIYATGYSEADYFDLDPGPGENMLWRDWPYPSQGWAYGFDFLMAFPLEGIW